MRNTLNEKGFSITELMIAMTILAVGLLALAQMQIMALQGTSASNQFSKATNLARDAMEETKIPGIFVILGSTINLKSDILRDWNRDNNETGHAPSISTDTDINTLGYDTIQVLAKNPATNVYDIACEAESPANCNAALAGEWDYVRIVNVRNLPLGEDEDSTIMKDINLIVLWKDRGLTRSVNLRSIVARKDDDFF